MRHLFSGGGAGERAEDHARRTLGQPLVPTLSFYHGRAVGCQRRKCDETWPTGDETRAIASACGFAEFARIGHVLPCRDSSQ